MKTQITTVTFFRYAGWGKKLWALAQMQRATAPLQQIGGLEFFKLMGSGAGEGFSLRPDFSTYCLFAIWEEEAAARRFFAQSELFQRFCQQSEQQWTLYLVAQRAKGLWAGAQPFRPVPDFRPAGPLIVLTRATIHWRRLREFWQHVPQSSEAIQRAEGVLFTKGVGELPWVQQATVSVWESAAAMRTFAYRNGVHQRIIKKTKERQWYSEELFAGFALIGEEGEWTGAPRPSVGR
ncbi:MAG: DUF3291 domain-containing protein [Bacteroidota bacterium]